MRFLAIPLLLFVSAVLLQIPLRHIDTIPLAPSSILPVLPTEKRKIIAIVDTGVDMQHPEIAPFLCEGGHVDFVGTGNYDTHGHGTHVAGLITKGLDPKQYCIIALKYYDSGQWGLLNLEHEIAAFEWAITQKATLINFSGGGAGVSSGETQVVTKALNAGIKVVVAAGNEGNNFDKICNYFPACLPKHQLLYPVGSTDRKGEREPSSNYGGPVVNWAPGLLQYSTLPSAKHGIMSGTSQATANFSNKLLGGKGESFLR